MCLILLQYRYSSYWLLVPALHGGATAPPAQSPLALGLLGDGGSSNGFFAGRVVATYSAMAARVVFQPAEVVAVAVSTDVLGGA